MTENQLETFQAIVSQGSYSRAAEELHLSQPTVSYRIRTLEEELGVKLFVSLNGQTSLTQAGQAFVQEAALLRQGMQAARMRMRQYSQAGGLTIGFPEMMMQGRCDAFLQVMQLTPAGAATLNSCKLGKPPEDVQQLIRGEADLIFTDVSQPALKDARLATRALFHDHSHVCMRRDHPLAGEAWLTLEQLRGETIRRYDDPTFFWEQMASRLEEKQISVDETNVHMTFIQLLPQLTAFGGVILTNQPPVANAQLTHVPLRLENPIDVGVAWRRASCPPVLKQLIRSLTELPEEAWW